MAKKRVLIIYRSYFPSQSHAGPATAIRNLVLNMSEHYDFHILTLNHDFTTGKELFPDGHHIAATLHAVVEYVARGPRALLLLAQRLREGFDIIDVQCAFDPLLAIPALMLCKLGLAGKSRVFHTPHGIYMNAIMSQHALRKRAFCLFADFIGLYRGVTHLAGSRSEMRDIHVNHQTSLRVEVTSQFVEKPEIYRGGRKKQKNTLKIAFVGRVVPQKNLVFALEVIRTISEPSTLDIYGDTSDRRYLDLCRKAMQPNIGLCQIRFMGDVAKKDLLHKLRDYDVLLHPTLGENFGHAIVEALHIGLPVLISDQAPWTDVSACNAGWALPLTNPRKFVEKLEAIYAMDDEWSQLSFGAVEYANRVFDREETSKIYRAAYG